MLVFDESSMKTVIFELRLLKELKPQPDVGKYFFYLNRKGTMHEQEY